MILFFTLLNFTSHALTTRHIEIMPPKVQCKHVTELVGDGCNVCTRKVCTDKKVQWQEGPASCSAKICSRSDKRGQQPYNPKEWDSK